MNWNEADRLDLNSDVMGGSKTEVTFAFLNIEKVRKFKKRRRNICTAPTYGVDLNLQADTLAIAHSARNNKSCEYKDQLILVPFS